MSLYCTHNRETAACPYCKLAAAEKRVAELERELAIHERVGKRLDGVIKGQGETITGLRERIDALHVASGAVVEVWAEIERSKQPDVDRLGPVLQIMGRVLTTQPERGGDE